MKTRITALVLALALAVSAGVVSVLAEGGTDASAKEPEQAQPVSADVVEESESEEAEPSEAAAEPASPAGPDRPPETEEEEVPYEPDPAGDVSFVNVERRMREGNLQILILEEQIQTIEDIDYDKTYEDLRKQLNQIAQAQWALVKIPAGFISEYEKQVSYDRLDQAYKAVREQFEAIKEGDMQKDNADVVRQLRNLQDQIVMAGEALYVTLTGLDTQEDALVRQLEALDRTVQEMELRYQLGQISALQLQQVKGGRAALSSGLETLRMNTSALKRQLENLLGAELSGSIRLGPVPAVTDSELAAMDPEQDLQAAKGQSYELYQAEKTLEDARDDYKKAGDRYGYLESEYGFKAAKHTWNSAQYTYQDTVQGFELKFRTLYGQVKDYKQVLDAARVSLACEQESFKASELRYQQGTISKNALADARDSLRTAEEKVRTASNDLFSEYNTYCWAVQHGILN